MFSDFRFRRGGVFGCAIALTTFAALLFVTGCTTNGSSNSGPTAPNLTAAVVGQGSVSPAQVGASYSITVSNGAGALATSGTITVTDPPTNFTVTSISGTGWTCVLATLTCTRSDALPAGQSYPPIIVTGNVTGAAGQSISVPITISGGGLKTNVNASPTISIVAAPSIAKAFNPVSIGVNANSALTFTITNPSVNTVAEGGLAFADTLPTGLVVATPNGLANTCSGTVTATAGSGSISLSGGTVATSSTCTVTVNVTGTAAGVFSNTSGAVSSTNGGTGNTASATLTVVAFPTISKAFGAASIILNASTSLTFTITNPVSNTAALAGLAFTDTLPAGLVVSTPNGLADTCGGTASAVAGSSSVSLTGGTVAASSTCTVSLNVTGTTAGTKPNTTGAISSTQSGAGATSNTATLAVIAPPSISKAFGSTGVTVGGTTMLTFTLTNPAGNPVALSGVAFTDTLPVGTVVATPNNLVDNCGGTATAVAGSGTVSLTGASVAPTASCTVGVNVTATTAGNFTNTTGAVSSTNGGTGNTASANLSAALPPTISKAFGALTIPLNGTTSLTFTITNPAANPANLTGIAFSDPLPAGLVVATPNGLANTCGGTVTAVAGSSSASLAGGTVAQNSSCTLTVNVAGSTGGLKSNTTQAISSTQTGAGTASNTATLTVIAPPTISKNFGAATVALNASTSLTFTITNPNASNSLSGVAFTDTLPTGMSVSTPNGLSGTCGTGTITATAGTNSVSLTGGTLAAAGSCNFSVNVTPTVAGANNNTTGNVSSTEGGVGNTASANLSAIGPPSISKRFGATGVAVNGSTSLTFTITNPNTVTLSGLFFTDNMPAGLVVAATPGITNTCAGTVTAAAGSGSVNLTGGSVSQSTNCAVSVNITATVAGAFTNTTGAVTSTNGGTGNTATANLSAAAPPTISKAFGASSILLNGSTSLTFTITNPSANTVALTGIGFTDTLPSGLVVATPNGLSNTCSGAATATPGSSSVNLAGGTVAANSNCTIVVNVMGVTAGVLNNTTGAISSTQSGAGTTSNTATITVVAPPTISKAFGAGAIVLNASTSLTFTINNPNATNSLGGVGFTDTLTGGLQVSSPNGLTGSCGSGTITAVAGSTSVGLSAGTIAAGGSCSFSVNVTGTLSGTINNTTSAITSTEGGTGSTSNTASLTVFGTPTITILSSNSGPVGSSITITGTNFGSTQAQGSSTVTVNGVTATPTSWSATSIKVTVPSGATGTGNVIVTVLGVATATSSATQFTVLTCSNNCSISGNTSGAWAQGVTITLSGSGSGTTTTDASGNYTFTGLTAGGSYTVTPSLAGYTYTPSSLSLNNLSGSATGQNFVASSAVQSFSISGTLSGSSDSTHIVYINVYNCGGGTSCSPIGGTSLPSITTNGGLYTVRGLPAGNNYSVRAVIDLLGNGAANEADLAGTVSAINITNADVTSVNITVAAQTIDAPAAPGTPTVFAGSGTAFVTYNQPTNNNTGDEIATQYTLHYGTASNNLTQSVNIPAGNPNQVYVLPGLTNGTTYYFAMSATNSNGPSAASATSSAVLIHATTGLNTVSGTVTFTGTPNANAPLYVGVYSNTQGVYFERIAPGFSSGVAFSFAGIPSGNYSFFAVIDQNANGFIDGGDITNFTGSNGPPPISVNTSLSGQTIALGAVSGPNVVNATTSVSTFHSFASFLTPTDSYGISVGVNMLAKRPVSATLFSGPNVGVPFDITTPANGNSFSPIFTNSVSPIVGDTYLFLVTYSDGSTQVLQGKVTTVLTHFAQNLAMQTTSPGSPTVPLLTWAAPSPAPAAVPYTYSVGVFGGTENENWFYYGGQHSNGIPSTTTSVLFNTDNSASPNTSLTPGNTYDWYVQVQDANGNSAQFVTTYKVPGGAVGPATQLKFTTQPGNATAGNSIPTFQVTIEDASGNTVTSSSDSISVAIGNNPGSGTLSGNTQVNAVNGVATFQNLSINNQGSGYTLTASDITNASLTGATSSSFNVTPACSSNCTLSGTITSGPQVSGVTITITGPAPSSNNQVTTTNSSGAYTFTSLTAGSYLVTPTLGGYTFSPAAPNVIVSGTQNFTETSALTSFSISGTVSYGGSKTGRVFILVEPSGCNNCGAVASTSIALTGSVGSMSGAYTVRGLLPSGSGQNGNGSFKVVAEMDNLNTGQQNDSNPSGSNPSTVTITNANVTGVDVTLTDPAPPTPVALDGSKISINPGNGVVVIQYKAPTDSNGIEIATAYNVYYGTTNPPTNVKQFKAQGHNQDVFILSGLTNGATNFQLSALVGSTESAKTSVFPITVGATSGSFTVSGTVTVPSGAGNGPLYVGVYGGASGNSIYVERIAPPYTSPVSYSVSGVPAGTYQNFAIIDENSDGEISVPDLDNVGNNGNPPTVTVTASNVTNANVDLTLKNVASSMQVATNYQQNGGGSGSSYNLSFQVTWGTKRPVAIAMISGPNVPVPSDLTVDENNSQQSLTFGNGILPVVGDTYQFQVLYADGSTGTLTASVTTVFGANNVATSIGETTTSPYTRTVPLFTWSAPLQPPSGTYYYAICVNNNNGSSLNWCDFGHGSGNGLPSSQTSIQYDTDGSASSPSLTSGTQYNINLSVIDSNGDSASTITTYVP